MSEVQEAWEEWDKWLATERVNASVTQTAFLEFGINNTKEKELDEQVNATSGLHN